MKTIFTSFKILVTLVLLFAATAVKAQVITNSSGLAPNTIVYCPTDQVKFTGKTDPSLPQPTSYTWTRYAGQTATGTPTPITAANATNVVDTPPGPGYYTYVATGVNASGCMSDPSPPVVIYVLPAVNVSIAANTATPTGPVAYCVNQVPSNTAAITFTATATTPTSATDVFGYTYQWYKGGVAIAGPAGTASTYTLASPGDATTGVFDYTVQVGLQIKTCTPAISNAINVTVNAIPGTPTITITP